MIVQLFDLNLFDLVRAKQDRQVQELFHIDQILVDLFIHFYKIFLLFNLINVVIQLFVFDLNNNLILFQHLLNTIVEPMYDQDDLFLIQFL
jgi:hypothetical protein